MMERQVLLKYKSLEFCYEPEISEDIEEAVKNAVLGNPTGLQYRHLDATKKIHDIYPIDFFTLRRDGILNFVLALVERITFFNTSALFTYNVRYVSFNQKLAKKIGNDRRFQAQRKIGNSFIKEGLRKIAESFQFVLKEGSNQPEKKVYYAYVEESNIRSLEFTQFFFEKIREITAISYCRLFPRKDTAYGRLKEEERSKMKELLDEKYKNNTFYFIDEGMFEEDYFVLREKDEIIVGAKIQKANWKMVNVPGFAGKILLRIIPFIPVLSRILRKGIFQFLTIDTLYCKPGNEDQLQTFLNAALASNNVCSCFLYFDREDTFIENVKKIKRKGLINRFFKEARGAVLARFINFSEEEKRPFYSHPVFVSAYDMT